MNNDAISNQIRQMLTDKESLAQNIPGDFYTVNPPLRNRYSEVNDQTITDIIFQLDFQGNIVRFRNQPWDPVKKYISEHSKAKFSHGLCPDPMEKLYPEFVNIKKG